MQIVREKQEFERVVVTREEALSMFEENKFKAEIINGLPQDATISLYRCGPMVGLSSVLAVQEKASYPIGLSPAAAQGGFLFLLRSQGCARST